MWHLFHQQYYFPYYITLNYEVLMKMESVFVQRCRALLYMAKLRQVFLLLNLWSKEFV